MVTQKQVDYILFREVVMMMQLKEHLTEEGLNKIVSLRAQLNWGLSDELKAAFPNSILHERPILGREEQKVPILND